MSWICALNLSSIWNNRKLASNFTSLPQNLDTIVINPFTVTPSKDWHCRPLTLHFEKLIVSRRITIMTYFGSNFAERWQVCIPVVPLRSQTHSFQIPSLKWKKCPPDGKMCGLVVTGILTWHIRHTHKPYFTLHSLEGKGDFPAREHLYHPLHCPVSTLMPPSNWIIILGFQGKNMCKCDNCNNCEITAGIQQHVRLQQGRCT